MRTSMACKEAGTVESASKGQVKSSGCGGLGGYENLTRVYMPESSPSRRTIETVGLLR